MTDILHDLRPRFIVHATPAVASSRRARNGTVGVYDRLYCWREIETFSGAK